MARFFEWFDPICTVAELAGSLYVSSCFLTGAPEVAKYYDFAERFEVERLALLGALHGLGVP